MQLRFLARLAFFICLCVVLIALFHPQPPEDVFQQSDKLAHLMAFLALGITGRLAFPNVSPLPFWSVGLLAAVALECLQPLVQPSRHFSYLDMLANSVGVLLAAAILWLRRRLKP